MVIYTCTSFWDDSYLFQKFEGIVLLSFGFLCCFGKSRVGAIFISMCILHLLPVIALKFPPLSRFGFVKLPEPEDLHLYKF